MNIFISNNNKEYFKNFRQSKLLYIMPLPKFSLFNISTRTYIYIFLILFLQNTLPLLNENFTLNALPITF